MYGSTANNFYPFSPKLFFMMKIILFKKKIYGILLLLLSLNLGVMAQNITVKGKVTDQMGNTLPSVSVIVYGTTHGTITDIEGNYTLEAPADGTLQYNFLGYAIQRVPVNNRQIIDVVLQEDLLRLDEVVVVGYGVQRKSDITGAITSVDVGSIRDVAASSITKSLQGKTAGVEIQNIGAKPGSNTQIRIRGNRSLTASNDPLLIVDGIPYSGNLSDIASDDVESLEILKDASATVIYGSRGANGVIIVTTKRGKSGKPKITYNGYAGVSNVSKKYDVYNGEEFIKLRDVAGFTAWSQTEIESMMTGRETDWQDIGYQSGVVTNHEVGVNGGSEETQYSFSLGYYDESYVITQMGYERYNTRLSIDQKIGNHVKAGISTMNSLSITDAESADPTWSLVSLSPLAVPYKKDGSLIEQPTYGTDDTYSPLTLQDKSRWGEQRRKFTSFNTAYLLVDIWNGIQYKLNAGLDFRTEKYNRFYGSDISFQNGALNEAQLQNLDNLSWRSEEHTSELQSRPHLVCRLLLEKSDDHRDLHSFPTRRSSDLFTSFNTAYLLVDIWNGIQYKLNAGLDFRTEKYNRFYGSDISFQNGALNEAQLQNLDNLSWTVENMILWEKSFGPHRLNFTGMQSAQKSTSTSSRFSATDVAADYLQYNNFFLSDVVQATSGNNYFSEWSLLSYMARLNYVYDDRYLVTLTGRMDGSSRLAKGNKWHSYPAVAVAWNIYNESFLEDADFLSQLKLRLGYGQTSNTSINPYRTLGGLTSVKYSYGDTGVSGYYVSTLPNPNLGWEYTTSYNLGLDFGFFNGRLTGSVDAYLQQTNDLLLGKSLPYTTGVTGSFLENIGETENRGLEFVVNGNILSGRTTGGFKWDVNANIFLNREKI